MSSYEMSVLFIGSVLLGWSMQFHHPTEERLLDLVNAASVATQASSLVLPEEHGSQKALALTVAQIGSLATQQIVQKLYHTMIQNNGAGIAAPQIGVPLQIIIARVATSDHSNWHREHQVMFNPQIEILGERKSYFPESCLNLVDKWRFVARASAIRVSYLDLEGQSKQLILSGSSARVVQHEVDHLHGRLISDFEGTP